MRIPRIRRELASRSAFLSGALLALSLFITVITATSLDSRQQASAATNVTLTVDASQSVSPFRDTMRGVATNNWGWLWYGLWDREGSCCPAGKTEAIVDATKQLEPGIIRFAGGLWANAVGWDRSGTVPDDGGWSRDGNSYTHSYKPAMVDAFEEFRLQVGPGGGPAKAIIQVNVCDYDPAMWADMLSYSIEKGYDWEYWEIGNEQTLESCGLNATSYATRYAGYQAALKAVDPSVKVLGPINHQPYYTSWESALVDEMGQELDVLAWHWYQISEWTTNTTTFAFQGGSVDAVLAWGGNVGTVFQDGFGNPGDPGSIADGRLDRWTYRRGIAEQKMDYIQDNFISTGRAKADLETAITEYGVHASGHTNPVNGNHIAAIWLADTLARWAYNGLDIVTYYSLEDGSTGTGNTRGLIGTESSTTLDIRPTYGTEWLYANHFGDMMVQSGTSDPENKVVAWASTDSDDPGKLKLMLVNLSGDTAAANIQVSGFAPQSGQAYVMVSDDPLSVSNPDSFANHTTKINGVKIPDYSINNGAAFHAAIDSITPVTIAASSSFSYSIPAYAVVALELSGQGAPASTPTATPPATSTPAATATGAPATATSVPQATSTPSGSPTAAPQSGQWPTRMDLNVGESRAYTLQGGQTRTVTLVSYQRVIDRNLIKATVRVDGGGKSVTHTIDVTHAGVPVALNGVWVHGYAWKEADDSGFEDVGRQGGFPLSSGKDVGLAVNDAAYPFYPDLDDYVYPVEGDPFNAGAYLQTWLEPDGWAHSGFDIGTTQDTRLLAITDGYVWVQYYSGQGMMWLTTGSDQWSSPCWVFTHIDQGSALVSNGAFVTKGTPIIDGIFGTGGIHTHMGSCGSADLGSWLFAASVWNNQHASDYPAPRHWLGLGSYPGSIATSKVAPDESGDLPAGFAPEVGDSDLAGTDTWRLTDSFANGVVRVGELLSDAPFSGYSDRTGSNSMGYIATYIYSPVDYTGSSAVHLKLGVTRGARVWLNSQKVHDATEARYDSYNIQSQPAIEVDKYDYVLPLEKGWNTLIIKSDNGSRSDTLWGVSPKIGDASGRSVPGLVFSTRATKLSATGGDGSASLSWSPVNSHGAYVDSYKIDIATDAAFNSIVTTVDAGTATSKTVTGLAGGFTYYARVRPFNASELGGSAYWQHMDSVSFQTSGQDNVPPSQAPPGGLQPSQVPMFVLLGSDDNNRAGGMEFFLNAFQGRTNPAGSGNPATFDGEAAAMSFYIIGTNIYGPNISSAQWRDQYMAIYESGHELGNHGFYGLANNASRGSLNNWLNNWMQPTQDAIEQMFVEYGYTVEDARAAVQGYRAAQDILDPYMYQAIEAMGYTYGNSSTTNHSTNQPAWWPGTLDDGWPGGATWDNRDFGSEPGVWEVPQTYNSSNSRYCDKDWFDNGDSTATQWLADAKATFLQLYNGGRAPFSLCLHSQEWGPTNILASGGASQVTASQLARQQNMNSLLDWLLSGQFPEVRLVTHSDLINWMRNPVALGTAPQNAPGDAPAVVPTAQPSATATPAQTADVDLVVSGQSNRANSVALNGKKVSGDIYVSIAPDSQVTYAGFYIDNITMSGNPDKEERVAAFDLMGTSADSTALPYNTRNMPEGKHSITVRVTLSNGSSVAKTAQFEVDNIADAAVTASPSPTATASPTAIPSGPASPTPTAVPTATSTPAPTPTPTPTQAPSTGGQAGIVVSYNALRTGSANLDGADIDGTVYIWAYPDDGLHRVSFYLDNSSMSGAANRTESVVPFDFAGTSWTGNAQPFDTRLLGDGTHTMTMRVRLPDGSEYVKSASFVVSNGSSTEPQPSPTPTPTPTATATTTPSSSPTPTASPTPAATPTASPTPAATPTASPTPRPGAAHVIDVLITSGQDDVMHAPNGWPGYDDSSAELFAGNAKKDTDVWIGWRWQDLNIPAGAVITVAYVELQQADATWNIETDLALENTANPAGFSASQSPWNRWQDRTDFTVTWRWRQNGGPVSYQTPSLVAGVQELVNRYGGVDGLTLLESGDRSNNGRYHSWAAYEHDSLQPARLHIEYTMP